MHLYDLLSIVACRSVEPPFRVQSDHIDCSYYHTGTYFHHYNLFISLYSLLWFLFLRPFIWFDHRIVRPPFSHYFEVVLYDVYLFWFILYLCNASVIGTLTYSIRHILTPPFHFFLFAFTPVRT